MFASKFKSIYQSAAFFKFGLTWFGPYWGTGIRVAKVAQDFSQIDIEMRSRWFNGNAFNTHFGGSLYAMCDPFYCLMLVAKLGKGYVVWDKAASIDFVKPGKGTVRAVFTWSDEQIAQIRAAAEGGEKVLPERDVEIVDETGEVVARVHKVLYVRKKRLATSTQ